MSRRHRFLAISIFACAVLAGYWALRGWDSGDTHTPAPRATIASESAANPQPTLADDSRPEAQGAQTPPARTGTLRGRVIDAVTNRPVTEFELRLHDRQHKSFRADDGRFRWDIPAGRWGVTLTAHGYQRFEAGSVEVKENATTREIVIPLRSGFALRGRVYDEASQQGIANAQIQFRESQVGRFEGNFRDRVTVRSGKDGSFTLDGVPAGRVTLSVWAQNYAGRELDALVGEKTPPLSIGLSVGGMIAGYFTAADGSTPVGGMVGLAVLDKDFAFSVRTSETGEFSFKNLAPGRYRLFGHSEGRSAQQFITLGDNDRREGIVLALSVGRSIHGVVTGLSAEDIARTTVSVQPRSDGGESGYAQVPVDANGAFALHGVSPGRLRIAANVSARRQIGKEVEMPAEADLTVNLDFPRGARLTGRVTHGGKPMRSARLQPVPLREQNLYLYEISASAKGEYAIENLPPGDYFLRIGNFRTRAFNVGEDTVFDVDVPLAQLSGRVVEEPGNAPVGDVDIELWPARSRDGNRVRDRTDSFGEFAMAGLEPGDFVISAYRPGYEMYRQPLSYGAPIDGMTIRLRKADGVTVRVRDAASGKPIREVYLIETIGDRRGSAMFVRLDEEGKGFIPAALAGSSLSFSATGYAARNVSDWSGEELEISMQEE